MFFQILIEYIDHLCKEEKPRLKLISNMARYTGVFSFDFDYNMVCVKSVFLESNSKKGNYYVKQISIWRNIYYVCFLVASTTD